MNQESVSIPSPTQNESNPMPIDTTTQGLNMIGALEDMMSFAALKTKEAKHLHETATYLAAKEQVGDNAQIKLAEITYETLKENLQVVLEDCGECGLNTGLECLVNPSVLEESNQIVNTTFLWIKRLLAENLNGLTALRDNLRSNLNEQRVELEKFYALVDFIGNHNTKEAVCLLSNINSILIEPCDCHSVNRLVIQNAASIYRVAYDNVISKVINKGLVSSASIKEELSELLEQHFSIEDLNSESNSKLVANLTGGVSIYMSELNTNNKTTIDFSVAPNQYFGPLMQEAEYKVSVLTSAERDAEIRAFESLISNLDESFTALEAVIEQHSELCAMIHTLVNGTWYMNKFDNQVFKLFNEKMYVAQYELRTIVQFLYGYVEHLNKVCQTASAILDLRLVTLRD